MSDPQTCSGNGKARDRLRSKGLVEVRPDVCDPDLDPVRVGVVLLRRFRWCSHPRALEGLLTARLVALGIEEASTPNVCGCSDV